MRTLKLTAGDLRVQWQSGFYAVYAIFTAVYLVTLAALPATVRQTVAVIMVFTDPAALGLFFMGALILREKSQHVTTALAASPVRVGEYCAAKLLSLSLALLGLLVAVILAAAGGITVDVFFVAGVLLASFLFSACGLIAAEQAASLNQFVLLAVPFELFICLPPALLLFGTDHPVLALHPGVAAVRLIGGIAAQPGPALFLLGAWCLLAVAVSVRVVGRQFQKGGGNAA